MLCRARDAARTVGNDAIHYDDRLRDAIACRCNVGDNLMPTYWYTDCCIYSTLPDKRYATTVCPRRTVWCDVPDAGNCYGVMIVTPHLRPVFDLCRCSCTWYACIQRTVWHCPSPFDSRWRITLTCWRWRFCRVGTFHCSRSRDDICCCYIRERWCWRYSRTDLFSDRLLTRYTMTRHLRATRQRVAFKYVHTIYYDWHICLPSVFCNDAFIPFVLPCHLTQIVTLLIRFFCY